MSISIKCPYCAAKIKLADDRYVGKKVSCPSCRAPFVVKLPDEPEDELPPEEPEEELPAEDEFPNEDEFPADEEISALRPRKKTKGKSKSEKEVVAKQRPTGQPIPPAVYFAGSFGAVFVVGMLLWWMMSPGAAAKPAPQVAKVDTPAPPKPPAGADEKPVPPGKVEKPADPMPPANPMPPQKPVAGRPPKKLSPLMVQTFVSQVSESMKKSDPTKTDEQLTEMFDKELDNVIYRGRMQDPDYLCLTAADEKLLEADKPLANSERRIKFAIKQAAELKSERVKGISLIQEFESGKLPPKRLELLAMMLDKAWKGMVDDQKLNTPDNAEKLRALEEERLGYPVTLADLEEDVMRRRAATADLTDVERMKRLLLELHNYHDVYTHFPGASRGRSEKEGGKSGLSWRVHLLSVMRKENENTAMLMQLGPDRPNEHISFEDFHPDEPWDSPHNIKQVDRMPLMYQFRNCPPNKTSVHVAIDAGTPFGNDGVSGLRHITAGSSLTIATVLGGPETAVEWTKPGGLELNAAADISGVLGTPARGGYIVGLFDGAVRRLKKTADFATVKECFIMQAGKPRDIDAILIPN